MLFDTNLILQYIDQRKLHKLQQQHASSVKQWNGLIFWMNINVGYQDSEDRYKSLKVEIGTEFNWKIENSCSFTVNILHASSSWIANNSIISGMNGRQFRIICERNILIDENSAISMKSKMFGGSIIIYCDSLTIQDGGEITAVGEYMGGSIDIVTNSTNIDMTNFNHALSVDGDNVADGDKGLIRFGYFDQSKGQREFADVFVPNTEENVEMNFVYDPNVE